ncbi:MAG: non-hydrolyzing UDP-N-acetylglucosamine 2-epimerase [Candidatus Odinarchaeota archaeon]
MKIAIILGTRPEIIKLSPVIVACEELAIDYFILHTNQHYTAEMDQIFFDELQLPPADVNLNVGSGTHGYQTGTMILKIEDVLLRRKADVGLVQGDTNTVLAGSIASSKLKVKTGHVEAGLRSYDRNMPEEINRVVADHVADYCFVPTPTEEKILLAEAISKEKIFVTGNTIVDAVLRAREITTTDIVEKMGETRKNYIFLTAHRPENVDNKRQLESLLKGLELVNKHSGMTIIFPIHPRTKKKLNEFNLSLPKGTRAINPVSYTDSLNLQSNAKIILTDSGGIQEEACILGVPCVTLRKNTERPQTIEVGSNILVGVEPNNILEGYKQMVQKKADWANPFGDGKTGARIVELLKSQIER